MPAAVVLLRRVVHGLDIHSAVQLTDSTIAKIRQASALAPLHNPPGLQGIEAAMKVFGGVPQVGWGCFCIIVCCRRGSSEVCRAATHAFSSPIQIRKVLMRFTGAANPCAPEVSGWGQRWAHVRAACCLLSLELLQQGSHSCCGPDTCTVLTVLECAVLVLLLVLSYIGQVGVFGRACHQAMPDPSTALTVV
jgi:hypothetical protein